MPDVSLTDILMNAGLFLYEAVVAYAQTDEGKVHTESILEALDLGGLTPDMTAASEQAKVDAKRSYQVPTVER